MKSTRVKGPIGWRSIFRELDEVADGRTPAILLSFTDVPVGHPSDDYLVIRGSDWLALMGKDDPQL